MNTSSILLWVILAVLVASFAYIIQAEGGISQLERVFERVGIELPKPTAKPSPTKTTSNVPPEFQSGNSRFSQGSCKKDSDCVVGGCSGEVCGSGEGAITTCELGTDFPSEATYTCSCLPTKLCGWE